MNKSEMVPDEELFAQWVELYGSQVQAYIQSRVYDSSTAEDLAQETFCRAWSARESYQEQGSPKKYLFCIAERLIIDYRRKKRPIFFESDEVQRASEPVDTDSSAEQKLVLAENIQKLRSAMESLSDIQQQTLMLRYYGQFSFSEISEITQLPLGTVLSHCHRALEKLHGILGDIDNE
ncbi:MAG: RNA polymerase sigma factor [Thermoguttaceae bacterium]|nr:RNA polymerase sigma factor [Thermoguttaceae bacterium]